MNSNDLAVSEFLNNFTNYTITKKNAELLLSVPVCNHSSFYWFTETMPINLGSHTKNIDYINSITVSNNSSFRLLYYMIVNLAGILDRIETANTKILILPLEPLPAIKDDNLKIIATTKQFTYNDNEYDDDMYDKVINLPNCIPINKPKAALIIKNLLEICNYKVYYPTDKNRYPIQRAFLYNLFEKVGFDLSVNAYNIEVSKAIVTFINDLPNSINVDAIKVFHNRIIHNQSDVYVSILLACITSYLMVEKDQPSKYYQHLDAFEATILPSIANKLNKSIEVYQTGQNIYPLDLPTYEMPKYCNENEIANTTILKLLSNYAALSSKSTTLESLKLCKLQVQYIISAFPFYNNKWIRIEGDELVFDEIDDSLPSTIIQPDKFKSIKKLVSFNGNYEVFRSLIEIAPIKTDEVMKLLQLLYKNIGFKCSVIIAELLNYHLSMNFNTRAMYNLISKLSNRQQAELDNTNVCKVEVRNANPIETLRQILNIPYAMIPLNIDSIENTIETMNKLVSLEDRIITASTTNYNCLPLIQAFKTAKNAEENMITNIKLLMLYSNFSYQYKSIIYSSLPRDIKFPSNITYANTDIPTVKKIDGDAMHTIATKQFSLDDCRSLLDYFKKTRDPSALTVYQFDTEVFV
ncbi:hypothetical protein PmNV_087 [Penaeus monodon nudivirus]|uniref:Uncharacterized protein n=1 Tax=Penaeus monodon nudivirus TaxID=1529056 RepID=A0A076FE17_9VIRU|nr:hypothetical protein PmNV_087 [Penaeus monodon nudivirus]AII15875.1 hypothetical protein PmNV_087 [Penaeus monodon nudivirus]